MERNYQIHKAGGIILKERKLLVAKSVGKDFYVAPGGKLDLNETSRDALIRELKEEFAIEVLDSDLEEFGTFYAEAAGKDNQLLRMDVFIVIAWNGEITNNERQDLLWINSNVPSLIKVGSIFEHDIIPKLKVLNLID
jgi:8-oxo-dGTP diphosphatase